MEKSMSYRIGVDVGGTFTDFLVTDAKGNAEIFKTSTTPEDPSIGFFRGLEKAAEARDMELERFLKVVHTIVHGTTITTNAALTGEGAKTGFITTHGFRDVLNMRRGLKERQFEKYAAPPPLVPRHLIRTVRERVNVEGEILLPLHEGDVREAAAYFRNQGVEAVAVSLLWSFANPEHERAISRILAEELPGVYQSLSIEILPQIRVYERHSTTVLNAYVGPVLKRYLTRLEEELASRNFEGTLLIMQSNGGVMSPEVAQRFASNTLLSGPAGAPMAGVFYGQGHGFNNIITVDMGGTSFDVALVRDAAPSVTTEGMIGDYRIASPILDIHTVGAGGGSVAWINHGGLLEVGPKSAGAKPGPACYGRGGTEATVTDAQYLLGYLDPGYFEEGEISFDADAAHRAIEEHVARPLQMDAVQAAGGIFQLVNNSMAAALGVVSVERGYDPREFVLVVAGGAGPIHAAPIARELDIPLILIPRESSVFCAAGMLISDLKHDYVRTMTSNFEQVDIDTLEKAYREMEQEALTTLARENVEEAGSEILRSADLRYVGQFNEVEVPVPGSGEFDETALDRILGAFHEKHDMLYGYSMPGAETELINIRVSGRGKTTKPRQEIHEKAGNDSEIAGIGERQAWFDGEFHTTPVYDGLRLQNSHHLEGPAIVVQPTTTIIVPPDFALLCDAYNNYLMYPRNEDVQVLCAALGTTEN